MLKPNRSEDPYGQNIKPYFPDPAPGTAGTTMIAERGGVACLISGDGATTGYPGDTGFAVSYPSSPANAVPVGILLYDVWRIDTNRQHENWYKSGFQARAGQKVCTDARGEYHTNMIPSGVTNIAQGQPAYLAANGLISNVQATNAPRVGTWQSAIDADGYAVIRMNIA